MARCSHLKNCPVTTAQFALANYVGERVPEVATARCTCDELRADHVLARVRHRKGRVKFLADARIYLQQTNGFAADRDALAILRAAQVDAAEVQ